MPISPSKFVWYELMTTDMAAAEAFYRQAIGWTAEDAGMPGMSYTIFSAGETSVAGLMDLPDMVRQSGGGPTWIGYVGVEDVDAGAAALTKASGAVYRPPSDIPGVGRFAIVGDPQGAVFALFKSVPGMERPAVAPHTPGHGGWHELHANDHKAVFAFYAKLFGWTKGEALDMGTIGTYQIFAAGESMIGGMMNDVPAPPQSYWLYYFTVDAIDAASKRVQSGGGKVLNGPQEVPGGAWIIQCLDPQGATFALVGPRG
jgi:predicted enzyme related to lactoylglutathione lyase